MTFESAFVKGYVERRQQTVIDAIDEEIRLYGSQAEFHTAMHGLARLYAVEVKSPLAQSLLKHAYLANAALALTGHHQSDNAKPVPERAFLSGEILALHIETGIMDYTHRQSILKQEIELVSSDDDSLAAQGQIAETFLRAMDNPIEKIYTYAPDKIAQKIVDAATLYDDTPNGTSRDRFVAGYRHSLQTMSAVSQSKPHYPRSM